MIIEGKINWVTCSHLGQVYVELVWVRGIPRFKVNGGGRMKSLHCNKLHS
jgi:hypothetical protein